MRLRRRDGKARLDTRRERELQADVGLDDSDVDAEFFAAEDLRVDVDVDCTPDRALRAAASAASRFWLSSIAESDATLESVARMVLPLVAARLVEDDTSLRNHCENRRSCWLKTTCTSMRSTV